MKIVPLVIGVVVLILAAGYLATSSSGEDPARTNAVATTRDTETDAPEESTRLNEAAAVDQATTTADPAATSTTPGVYTDYDADAIASSDAEHILLFFHATWCPSCRALDNDIVANADDIPTDVEIYKVDYDTATDLKRQYGVTTQHSILEINASGEAESGISHGLTLDDVLTTL